MKLKDLVEGLGGVSGSTRSAIAGLHDKNLFSKKIVKWEDAEDVSAAKLNDLGVSLKDLDRFTEKELYGKTKTKPTVDEFVGPAPQAFIVNIGGKGSFLIDTQGYDYARYVIHIV